MGFYCSPKSYVLIYHGNVKLQALILFLVIMYAIISLMNLNLINITQKCWYTNKVTGCNSV